MPLTRDEAAERWRAAKHLTARALAQLAELDAETNGPQQMTACILATETDRIDKLLAAAVSRFADE